MSTELENKLENMVTNAMTSNLQKDRSNWPYQSPEDYRAKTSKRFRMTKEQVAKGLSRDEAFEQFIQTLMTKQ